MTVTINGNGTITGIAEGGLPANTVTTATIKNDAVDGDKIADNAITSAHIAAGTVVASDIADTSVGLGKIENVLDGKIIVGNGSNRPTAVAVSGDVTLANTGAVTIANDAVEQAMIADNAVCTAQIAAEAVDLTKLPHGDGSSNGKFLRSNNAADPTWETVDTTTLLPLAGGTMTGDLLLDNEQELRLGEADGNGTNYVGFKAPAALSADKIWTLPSADGSASQVLQTNGSGVLSFATPAGGKIKQVRFNNSSSSGSANDTTYVDCGCSCTMTPAAAANYILVKAIIHWTINASSSSYEGRPSHSLKFKFVSTTDGGSNWSTVHEYGSWANGGQGAHWAASSGNNILHNLSGTFAWQWRIHLNTTNEITVKGQIAGGLENSNVAAGGNLNQSTMSMMELDGTGY